VSGPIPQRSSVPGRKFSINTSAPTISRRSTSAPSGEDRLIVMLFLLRPMVLYQSPTPSLLGP
jgi:hypothetical protein